MRGAIRAHWQRRAAGRWEPLGDQIAALRAAGATMIYKEKFRAFAPIARSLRK